LGLTFNRLKQWQVIDQAFAARGGGGHRGVRPLFNGRQGFALMAVKPFDPQPPQHTGPWRGQNVISRTVTTRSARVSIMCSYLGFKKGRIDKRVDIFGYVFQYTSNYCGLKLHTAIWGPVVTILLFA
jgi:hypothetical protein